MNIFLGYRIKKNVPLAPYTTIKIGGPAEFFCEPETDREFVEVARQAIERNVPVTILGRGANVLISDEGVRGLVIHPKNATYEKLADGSVRVGVGMDLGALARRLADDGFSGGDHLIGIPGTVGGAICGNAGKGVGGIGQFVKRAQAVRRADGGEEWLARDECLFAPRASVFQKNQFIVIAAEFLFSPDASGEARERMREYMKQKALTQPLAEATWGCTFRNVRYAPDVGNDALYDALLACRRALQETGQENMRRLFELIDAKQLLPASWLLDQAGCKGMRCGGLSVSDKHANFILNKGGGTAADARALIRAMKARVKEKFGLDLEEEVRYLPCGLRES